MHDGEARRSTSLKQTWFVHDLQCQNWHLKCFLFSKLVVVHKLWAAVAFCGTSCPLKCWSDLLYHSNWQQCWFLCTCSYLTVYFDIVVYFGAWYTILHLLYFRFWLVIICSCLDTAGSKPFQLFRSSSCGSKNFLQSFWTVENLHKCLSKQYTPETYFGKVSMSSHPIWGIN
jgi:hypothetical protein